MTLPPNKRYRVLMAILEYALDGVVPERLTPAQMAQFILVRPVLEAARKKAKSGSAGGKISRRPCAEKISKIEKEVEIENEIEADTEGFDEFWRRYPKKLARQAAREAWACVCHEKDKILSGLELWCRCPGWQKQSGRFVPKPEKWLRERWWEQDPDGAVPCGATGVLGQAELEAIQTLMQKV